MLDLNPRLVLLVVSVVGIIVYLFLERNKFDREGIAFLRRTQKGIDTVDRIAKRFPRFWKFYASTGVLAGLISIPVVLFSVGQIFVNMISRSPQAAEGGAKAVLPGVSSGIQSQPGLLLVPIEYWLIAIGIILTVHELSHAIIARLEGFDIKSVGYGFLAVIPIGFVEPEKDESLDKSSLTEAGWTGGNWKSRLKVLSAGSFANYLTAGVFLLLFMGSMAAVTTTTTTGYVGISVYENSNNSVGYQTTQGYPAAEANLTNGTLYSINDIQINSREDLRNVSESIQPGDTVKMNTSEGVKTVTAVEQKLTRVKEGLSDYRAGLSWVINLFYIVSFLNLAIGIFNMLPIIPLDGGLIVQTLVERFLGEEYVKYIGTFSLVMWALLITSIFLAITGL